MYTTTAVPLVLYESGAAAYEGKTACLRFTVGIDEEGAEGEPVLDSYDAHVFTMVDEDPNG